MQVKEFEPLHIKKKKSFQFSSVFTTMLITIVININAGREIRTPEVRDHWISNPTPYRAGPSPQSEWDIINQTHKKVMSKQILKYYLLLSITLWRIGQRNTDQRPYVML